MNKKVLAAVLLFGFIVSAMTAASAYAAHPMITDDTGTQGIGNMQFEFIGEYGNESEKGVMEKGYEAPTIPVYSYGISDTVDIVFGLPYVSVRTKEEGITSAVRGVSDASIELKARLYEKDGFSIALKPGVTLPTGDEKKGLGNGKISYSTFFIATKETDPWAFHFNVGYARNEYKLQADEETNRRDLWHVSFASQVEVVENLNLVANIGMERNPDKTSNTSPAFALGGFIYSITENFDIDIGIKTGLNKPESDLTVLAGIVWRL